jgi:hypothetical protein
VINDLEKSIPFFKFGAPNRAPYYYLFSLAHARNEGLWLEFGTHDATTINLIAEIMHKYGKENQIIYGFDSFKGLPEDWRKEGDRYNFDLKGKLPNVAWPNIRLVKGWSNGRAIRRKSETRSYDPHRQRFIFFSRNSLRGDER